MVRFTWQTLWAFLRISTNSKVFEQPLSVSKQQTLFQRGWTGRMPESSGPIVTDATLAAIAIEHGASLYTSDRDFSRFDGLSWINPLDTSDTA